MKGRMYLEALIMLLVLFIWHCGAIKEVPDELIGVWKPSEPQYADRSFELKKNIIIFGIGEGEFDIYTINNIKMKMSRDGTHTVYTIYYKDKEGEEYILAFYYYPEENDSIRIQYQEYIVWTKAKG